MRGIRSAEGSAEVRGIRSTESHGHANNTGGSVSVMTVAVVSVKSAGRSMTFTSVCRMSSDRRLESVFIEH